MRILETCLYAEDLVSAHAFYTQILGLEVISFDPERDLFLRCEGGVLIIFKASKTREGSFPVKHGTEGAGHVAFAATDEQIEQWRTRLASNGVPIEHELTWNNGARSLYFRDPAGNSLEFATPRLWGIED